jgi:hypothetical protein
MAVVLDAKRFPSPAILLSLAHSCGKKESDYRPRRGCEGAQLEILGKARRNVAPTAQDDPQIAPINTDLLFAI